MNTQDQSGATNRPGRLSQGARTLYLHALEQQGRISLGNPDDAEEDVRELLALGLLVPDVDEPGTLIAMDPAQLSSTLSTRWQQQALELLSQAISIPTELHELSEAFHSPKQNSGFVEYIRGKALINQRLQQLTSTTREEALAMQPGGPRPPEMLAASMESDLKTLRQGTAMRTIYHASTRYHQPTRDYVSTLSASGWQFRTLDEPYSRLFILDRRMAVIPVASDMSLAAFIHDQSVVNFLAEEIFERLWNKALDFDGERTVPQEVVSRLRQTIIDLLLAGTNHRVIARQLGISERTLARHLAEMREDYNVESLFQLGYVLGKGSPGS
ncbi:MULTISPECIES: helix-turn-helix domain-containing protein [Kitasatospora]|uniref:Putative regulatory protein n=1 Tax=Kitasatospora setae (strain ATCC 33774 / DSM 43861 / JCM 3304 / KCC A-0304 / NBRC 14216 / KM-6054) TaxID=452652 RepID=E4MZ41_KITSK|nr:MULTISPECIES: helix-turn-helix domain-containing protein [Kitasatospora]BAJ29615.1 putative regulatory protein [Kitasatospora setae KM-6054]